MEVLGIDEAALQQQVIMTLLGSFVVFFILAPLGGRFLHHWVARHLPEQSALALAAISVIVFLLSFTITLGILLRASLPISLEMSLLVSLISGLLAVGLMVLAVRFTIRRTTPPDSESPEIRSGAWGVWGDDARARSKNLHKRKR
jgi:integral membrane sensor domain MASE1